jgi:hypothetical protein
MLTRRIAIIAIPVVATVGAGTAPFISSASAAGAARTVVASGHCSRTSTYSLQVQREDTGQISVDWGVDMTAHVAGVAWHVTEVNNGKVFVNQTKRTAPDGSFSITRLLAPQNTTTITATATNPATGERCSAIAKL